MDKQSIFPRPKPIIEPPFQSGISDPRFPLLPAMELENDEDYNLYKGLVDKQNYAAILKANVTVKDKAELKVLFPFFD